MTSIDIDVDMILRFGAALFGHLWKPFTTQKKKKREHKNCTQMLN